MGHEGGDGAPCILSSSKIGFRARSASVACHGLCFSTRVRSLRVSPTPVRMQLRVALSWPSRPITPCHNAPLFAVPSAAERIRRVTPDAKLIFMIREPVSALFSTEVHAAYSPAVT